MTPNEVCTALQSIGANVSRRVLLDYEKTRLIPTPKRGGGGKNGTYTNYPPHTVNEAFAAWTLIHGKFGSDNHLFNNLLYSVSINMIKLVRNHYYSGVNRENIIISIEERDEKKDISTLSPEEDLSKVRQEAAKNTYYGIQQLWLSECKRAHLLLKNKAKGVQL